MKFFKKIITALLIILITLGNFPLQVLAYNPLTDFPNQSLREWPTQNYNYVATTLPEPPAIAGTVNMEDMFHYPELIYTGSSSDRPTETAKLKNNRSYVPISDSSVAVITRDARWQSGVMWSKEENKIKLNEPFHMVSYVYLGNRTQNNRNFHNLGGADGITFTMHNDMKTASDMVAENKLASGDLSNTGINAYGALGNGLGVYGSNFSADVDGGPNNMVNFWRGVENGITLEFDTFYNDNNTTQHSDNDLKSIVDNENHQNTQYGHIAINLLNDFKDNRANYNSTTNKHKIKLSMGWNGEVSNKLDPNSWSIPNWPNKPLADGQWHRLEVEWTPNTANNTGDLTYKIFKQGHTGSRNISDTSELQYDGVQYPGDESNILSYTVPIGTGDYSLEKVFGISNLNNTVYWGFSGSTGAFLNNQAVQMVQLPMAYYEAELRKVDQDNNPVSATFELEKKDSVTNDWELQSFYNPRTGNYVTQLKTEQHLTYQGVVGEPGLLRLTQLTEGTYRWKEVAAPDGYQMEQVYYPNSDGFVVEYDKSLNPNAFNFTAVNKRLYELELMKTDADTGEPLNNVPFEITRTDGGNTYYLKNTVANQAFEWTTNSSQAGSFLSGKSYTIDSAGQVLVVDNDPGKLTIKYFPDATNLMWEETSFPTGYDRNGTKEGVFVVDTENSYKYTATQTNKRLFQLSLLKKASDTQDVLPGAKFNLEFLDEDSNTWNTVHISGQNEFTTGGDGKITITGREAGKYRWKEVFAPTGYQLPASPYYPSEAGFDVTYSSGMSVDGSSQNYIFPTTEVTNQTKDLTLVLEKVSSTFQQPIQDVIFTLYSDYDGLTFSNPGAPLSTDSNGKIRFENGVLEMGKTYYLVESQTVAGFIRLTGYFKITTSRTNGIQVTYVKGHDETDNSPFQFEPVEGNIYSGKLKIYNKRESFLPTTGGNGILNHMLIGSTMIVLALLFFLFRKKAVKGMMILLLATAGLMGPATKTWADEQDQVTIEVNRLLYHPSDTQYKNGSPLAGAELEILDGTDAFYQLVEEQKLSRQDAQKRLAESKEVKGRVLAKATTGSDGKASFTVEKLSRSRPAVYLIREKLTPVAVTPMESLVLVLPILNDQGEEETYLSVYPKSHGTFTFDKSIDNRQDSYSFGEPIHYHLRTIIPQDIASLATYEIEDEYDAGLQVKLDSIKISVDGQERPDLVKSLLPFENRFRLSFDVDQLALYGGKQLSLTYDMFIRPDAPIDHALVNTATLYPGDLTPLVDREQVITGGFRFIKRAASGKQVPLAKAKFVIKDPTNQALLTYKDGRYQFEQVDKGAVGVVQLTSDEQGYFEIKGLRYGDYLLSEIQAPSGFVLNDKPTAFTISASTYTEGPVFSVYNVGKPKIILPQTGTVGTSLAFVGILLLASSLLMRKNKKHPMGD